MSRLRTLAAVTAAVRSQGLRVLPTLMREVVFECPVCKRLGLRSLASVEILGGAPVVRCGGCEAWGDDPFRILAVLGHDPDEGEPYEILLKAFDLWVALERERRSAA